MIKYLDRLIATLIGLALGSTIAFGLLYSLDTQVKQDYERCTETRSMYTFDSPPPCWVSVLTVD